MLLDGLAPPDPEPDPSLAVAPPDDAELDEPAELVGVVEVVLVEVVDVGVAGELATVEVGTVSGGAPEVSAAVDDPLPHAASAPDRATGAQSKASFLTDARSDAGFLSEADSEAGFLTVARSDASFPITAIQSPPRAFRARAAPSACRSTGSR